MTIHVRHGAERPTVRRWLSAARHPTRRDGVIAATILAVPWALAWALAPRHHLDASLVTILVAVTIPLATLWLTWATFRNASGQTSANSGVGPGSITAGPGSAVAERGGIAIGPGSVVADRVETAIGQVVYQQRRGVTGKPGAVG